MNSLENTVALVTGASSGIGEATARALAADGATLALVARRGDRLDVLVREIETAGGSALAMVADVTDREQAQMVVQRAAAELGRLDILVNNAGVMLLDPIEGAPIEDWDRMIDLNLTAALSMTHAALPHLLAAAAAEPRHVSDLVMVSSTAGRQVKRGSAVYNATKHGLNAFSESFRQEFSRRHVRVGVIEPGAVSTELRQHMSPAAQERQAQRLETMQPLEPDDIADAVLYMVTRPRHQMVNEILVRPTEQDD